MGERFPRTEEVRGSNPLSSTIGNENRALFLNEKVLCSHFLCTCVPRNPKDPMRREGKGMSESIERRNGC